MVSKNELKQLAQLGQKKYRKQHGLFAVEGKKAIATFLTNGYKLTHCFALHAHDDFSSQIIPQAAMKKLSNLNTPPSFWAAFKLPKQIDFKPMPVNFALDGIRDPGNLGTIIRLCDWFGIPHLICSSDTVDCFNPKVVQASMGSLAKVQVHYVHLPSFIEEHHLTPVCTTMKGESIYSTKLSEQTLLIIGNEGQGISDEVRSISTKSISIPSYGEPAAESLNAAMATGILMSEIKRKS